MLWFYLFIQFDINIVKFKCITSGCWIHDRSAWKPAPAVLTATARIEDWTNLWSRAQLTQASCCSVTRTALLEQETWLSNSLVARWGQSFIHFRALGIDYLTSRCSSVTNPSPHNYDKRRHYQLVPMGAIWSGEWGGGSRTHPHSGGQHGVQSTTITTSSWGREKMIMQ